MKFFRFLLRLLVFCVLTVLTQIGGLVYLVAILCSRLFRISAFWKRAVLFSGMYLAAVLILVPLTAPVFGREKIKNTAVLQPKSFFYVLANRNYVNPDLQKSLQQLSKAFNDTHGGLQLIYLDANFPFFDGIPLLPHRSHSDGKKIDLALIYRDASNQLTNQKPSVSGYGVFQEPGSGEFDQVKACKASGHCQYDFTKYARFGTLNPDLRFAERATRDLIALILKQKQTEKVFLEPHLVKRLGLTHPKMRFHGCRAVRHDDHIHLQTE